MVKRVKFYRQRPPKKQGDMLVQERGMNDLGGGAWLDQEGGVERNCVHAIIPQFPVGGLCWSRKWQHGDGQDEGVLEQRRHGSLDSDRADSHP